MKKLKWLLLATIASAMALSAQAFATPTATVDGITFNTGATFYISNIYEDTVAAPGDELSGFGNISFDSSAGLSCAAGPGQCSLRFEFSGYTVTDITSSTVDFNGGTVNFYTGDGDLFLSTSGHDFTSLNTGRSGTLLGNFSSSSASGQLSGTGIGQLDVTGGDAGQYFNTNTVDDGKGGLADFYFNSSFSNVGCPDNGEPLCGSGDLHGFAVPEPGSLAIFGLGLLGLTFALRRRQSKR
ncbi:MAG TPA: PEP-CTERM sorting domain-containing protein [Gammaproteobacteria bacterium]|nr:PEP-CTERM sorting domain-containing protein [Gammaproteobacteria bacterium]